MFLFLFSKECVTEREKELVELLPSNSSAGCRVRGMGALGLLGQRCCY